MQTGCAVNPTSAFGSLMVPADMNLGNMQTSRSNSCMRALTTVAACLGQNSRFVKAVRSLALGKCSFVELATSCLSEGRDRQPHNTRLQTNRG